MLRQILTARVICNAHLDVLRVNVVYFKDYTIILIAKGYRENKKNY